MPAVRSLEQRLRQTTRFHALVHVATCRSTQDLAAAPGEPRGNAVFWADSQTAGRGRKGRAWHGAAGQDVEVTFRVEGVALPDPARMATAVPTAFAAVLERAAGQRVALDWPNDLTCRGRKLCGVLIDLIGGPADTWLIGAGVDVNRQGFPPELREHATSLALLTGKSFDRVALVLELTQHLDRAIGELERGDHARLDADFRDRTALVGRRIRLVGPSIDITDRLVDLDLAAAHLASGRVVPLAALHELRLA